jgi:DNA polymerase-3 subunit alpha
MPYAEFVHLRCHSAFSLAEGAIKVKDLVGLAAQHAMPAIALTDSGNLFGAMEFSLAAAKNGVQPIIGCQVRLELHESDPRVRDLPPSIYEASDSLVVLAQNEVGYRNLVKMVSNAFTRPEQTQALPVISLSELEHFNEGLIVLSGGQDGGINRLVVKKQLNDARAYLSRLQSIFKDRLYLEIQRHGLLEEADTEAFLLTMADELTLPIVATNNVFFAEKDLYHAHDALLCVADGTYVNVHERRKVTPQHYFKSEREMRRLFSDLPEAIANTLQIARRCSYMVSPSKPMLPAFPTPLGEDQELRAQSLKGLEQRINNQVLTPLMSEEERLASRRDYLDRLEHELAIIIRMGYSGYYLIVADFIQWAKQQNIPVGPGRGSGAGSVVAWALTITDIDPIRFGLLFERFLNPERVSMPDFDVDFCQDRRDEVIQYVGRKYGHDHVAQIITFGKLQARAVLRDVGRVLGMPYGQVDRLSKMVPSNPANPVTLVQAIAQDNQFHVLAKEDPMVAKLLDMAKKLEGLYRHASTHAAGVVIGDRPLSEIVPLYHDGKSAMNATQFNMKDVELAGLVKFDFLGLKTLTIIQRTVDLVKHKGITLDISSIPLDDDKTFALLQRVEAVGIFQVESAGMRDVLRRLQPNRFEELIALVALYRPGPMDDIPRYLACKHGQEVVHYLHPALEDILKETFGVMVYQEQVMKIAQVLGGYSLGAADLLRRAMGKKIKQEMDDQRQIFVSGAAKNGVSEALASQIFDQMAKFAGYGFNKSHSAPYALITYQTAYLKANYPVEFMAATMTFDLNNTDKLSLYRQEMQRMGIPLLSPDVNASFADFCVEAVPDGRQGVRYALAALKNVGVASVESIAKEREAHGPFKDVFDFVKRLDSKMLNKRQFEHLVAAGAFDSMHESRPNLYQNSDFILSFLGQEIEERHSAQTSLFGGGNVPLHSENPVIPLSGAWSPLERSQKEFDAVGFYLSAHPLQSYEEVLITLEIVPSCDLMDRMSSSSQIVYMAGVVIAKKERMTKSGQRYAFVQFSDLVGTFEVTFFPEPYVLYQDFLNAGDALMLKISGRIEEEALRLTVQDVKKLADVKQNQNADLVIELWDDSRFGLAQIQSVLKETPKGPTTIKIRMREHSKLIQLTLPEAYEVSAAVKVQLRTLSGVRNLRHA